MENKQLYQERQRVILIVFLAYILPVLLVFLKVIPFYWRFYVLVLVTIVVVAFASLYQFSPVELGFTRNNLGKSCKAIAVPTLVSAGSMFVYYLTHGSRLDNSAYQWLFYLFFVGVSSPIQEFLYRGFLFAIFKRAKFATWLQIVFSTLLYSFVHLIYRDIQTLVFTLIIGVIWGYHYARFRNLYTIIISHSLLGAIAILVGLI
jgi:membrane protease YdiL (CAAX protease family)